MGGGGGEEEKGDGSERREGEGVGERWRGGKEEGVFYGLFALDTSLYSVHVESELSVFTVHPDRASSFPEWIEYTLHQIILAAELFHMVVHIEPDYTGC